MDPFSALPPEIGLNILESLTNLRDLQSAILCSKSLHYAYQVSRVQIRQRVFCNEIVESAAWPKEEWETEGGRCVFELAKQRVDEIETKNPNDALLLREAAWPQLIKAHIGMTQGKKAGILRTWSLDLAAAYRVFKHEDKARQVESQTMNLLLCLYLFPKTMELDVRGAKKLFLEWLHSTMTSCARYGMHEHGAKLFEEAWNCLGNPSHASRGPDRFMGISSLCKGKAAEASKPALSAVITRGWVVLVGMINAHRHFSPCNRCMNRAARLVAASESTGVVNDTILSHMDTLWRAVTPRTNSFQLWCYFFAASYERIGPGRLEGVMKIWERLCDAPDRNEARIQEYDLHWAKEVISEMQKQHGKRQSLEFHASVLPVLHARRSPSHYSFGWQLANAYVKMGDVSAAVKVQEQVFRATEPSESRMTYSLAGRKLAKLYARVGRAYEGERLIDEIEKKLSRAKKDQLPEW